MFGGHPRLEGERFQESRNISATVVRRETGEEEGGGGYTQFKREANSFLFSMGADLTSQGRHSALIYFRRPSCGDKNLQNKARRPRVGERGDWKEKQSRQGGYHEESLSIPLLDVGDS